MIKWWKVTLRHPVIFFVPFWLRHPQQWLLAKRYEVHMEMRPTVWCLPRSWVRGRGQ